MTEVNKLPLSAFLRPSFVIAKFWEKYPDKSNLNVADIEQTLKIIFQKLREIEVGNAVGPLDLPTEKFLKPDPALAGFALKNPPPLMFLNLGKDWEVADDGTEDE